MKSTCTWRIFLPIDRENLGVGIAYRVFKKASRTRVTRYWNWDPVLTGMHLVGPLVSAYLFSLCSPHFLLQRWASSKKLGKMAAHRSGSVYPHLESQLSSASVHSDSQEGFLLLLLLVTHLPLGQSPPSAMTGSGLSWSWGCIACLAAQPEPRGVGRGALARKKKRQSVAWGEIE